MPEDKSKVGVAIAIVMLVILAGLASGIYLFYRDELEQYFEVMWDEDKSGNENTTEETGEPEETEEYPEEVPEEEEPQEPENPEPPPSIPKPTHNVWTTFFYVSFDNNIGEWDSWASDLHYLEMVGSSDYMTMVALVDEEVEGDSHILLIKEGYSIDYSTSIINPLWGDELNMADPDTLYEFLKWGVETFPAQYYDVHLMDHGGAWMGVCQDDTSEDFLWAWEIADALSDVKKVIGRNIDIVSCDACLMGSFEFGYEISDCVDYLTACETYGIGSTKEDNFYYTGNWLYDQVWGSLDDNPTWTPEEFAQCQLDCFLSIGPFTAPDSGIIYTESSDTFAVINLKNIAPLYEALVDLAEELYASVEGVGSGQTAAERQLILSVIGHMETPSEFNTESFSGQMDFIGLATFTMYDLGDFVNRLADNGALLCSAETARSVKERLDNVVVACVHGDSEAAGEHPDAHGLSVYLPYRGTEYQPDYEFTRFAQDSMWDEFLREIDWM